MSEWRLMFHPTQYTGGSFRGWPFQAVHTNT